MKCSLCKAKAEYDEHWDAEFCRRCDKWLSEPCGATTHDECRYDCWKRPERPSLVPVAYVIGADEVGRGCLAGPLCVGAVMVLANTPLIPGVTDSKALSPKKREAAFRALKEVMQVVVFVEAAEIDRDGIGPCLKRAFREAIVKLLDQRTDRDRHTVVMVDGNPMNLGLGEEYEHDLTIKFLVKGDALDWRIGAASIVAKVTRDRLMVEEAAKYPSYGWANNMGYGSVEHQEAIREKGLTPQHRATFCRRFTQTPREVEPSILDLF